MNKRGLVGAVKITLILIILSVSVFFIYKYTIPTSASEDSPLTWTADVNGEPRTDFSPEDTVYILGKNFLADINVNIFITRPDGVVDEGFELTDPYGAFEYEYVLNGITGNYSVLATDGTNIATTNFTDTPGAIWTTRNDCGDEQQDVNKYNIGDDVYINGAGFSSGTKSWSIKGTPGSCDPNKIVASGTVNINSSGKFCFKAYTVQNGDCGVYQVKVDCKGDNYQVGDWCEKQTTEKKCTDASCSWCKQCKYDIRPTKTNQWLAGKCVVPGTDCGWHCEKNYCGATCSNGYGCPCPQDKCVGNDYYNYPANGTCKDCTTSCYCQNGTGSGQPCEPTITHCNDYDGCYVYGNGCEDRDYFCSSGGCNYTFSNRSTDYFGPFVKYCSDDTIRQKRIFHDFYCNSGCGDHTSWQNDSLVENCNFRDGWYNTTNTRWVNLTQCTEKEEKQQEYRNYYCSDSPTIACDYSVNDTRWIGTGNTRNKPYSTPCNDGLFCSEEDHCDGNGNCVQKTERDCSDSNECTYDICNETSDQCENPNKPDGTACSGHPGKCCFGLCDNDNVISNSDFDDECRSGPSCIAQGDWGYSPANQGNTCDSPYGHECYSPSQCLGHYYYDTCDVGYCDGAPVEMQNNSLCNGQDCGTCCVCNNGRTYDENQDQDCPATLCPDNCLIDMNPFTWDFADDVPNECSSIDTCTQYQCQYQHECHDDDPFDGINGNICGAECDQDSDCEDYCDVSIRYYNGDCDLLSTCACSWFGQEDCNDYDCTTPPPFICVGIGTDRINETGDDYDCDKGACGKIGTKNCSETWICDEARQCQNQACGSDDPTCFKENDNDWIWGTPPLNETNCSDGYDNDCDGLIDCEDPDCEITLSIPNKTVGEPKVACEQEEWCDWKITTLTPIIFSCENGAKVRWRYALDGEWEEWHNDTSPVTIYFPEESNHTLEAYCTNLCGISSKDSENFKVEGTAFEIPLYKKWNLISVPFVLVDDNIEEVFKDIKKNISSVWAYDGETDKWFVWTPDDDPENLDKIKPGWGYWVLSKYNTTLKIGGSLFSPATTPPSRNLVKGWNLIGYYGTDWQEYDIEPDDCGYNYDYGDHLYCALNSLVDTQQGYPRWGSLWSYINCGDGSAHWARLNVCDKMYAGKGYWIEMDVPDIYAPATTCIWNIIFRCE